MGLSESTYYADPKVSRAEQEEWDADIRGKIEQIRVELETSGYRPQQNAFLESFNGKFIEQCLNENIFFSLEHAREVIDDGLHYCICGRGCCHVVTVMGVILVSVSVLYRPLERISVFLPSVSSGLILSFAVREVQNQGAGSSIWSQLLPFESIPGLGSGGILASMAAILIATAIFTAMIGSGGYFLLHLKEIQAIRRQ